MGHAMRIGVAARESLNSSPHRQARFGAGILLFIFSLFVAALTGGCAIKLAPDYDKAIFDGLSKANEDAMVLFASTNSGPYSKRDSGYDTVIGELNAIQVQIKARGAPAPPLLLFQVTPGADKKSVSDALAPPTSGDVDNLLRIVNSARRADQSGRIKGRIDFLVEAFAVQMAQALAYEKALQR